MKWMLLSELLREQDGTGTGTPPPAPPAAWYAGKLDDAGVGHLQNRGLHDKPVTDVALAMLKAHQEAEKLIGAPADQVVRVPKDATDEAGWKAVWKRLGAGDTAKDYDLSGVKTAKGEPLPQALVDTIAGAAAKFGIPKTALAGFTTELQKHFDGQESAVSAEQTAALQKEQTDLKKNWGANFEANMFVARQAAQKLGIPPEVVSKWEQGIGYAKTMDVMRDLGMKLGEGKFIAGGDNNLNNGVMTKEQAVAKKAELMADTAWTKRYMDGGAAENREMTAVLAIINA